jgi:hypothetical protein
MTHLKNIRISTKIISTLVIIALIVFATVTWSTFSIVRDLTLASQKEKGELLIDTVEPSLAVSMFWR